MSAPPAPDKDTSNEWVSSPKGFQYSAEKPDTVFSKVMYDIVEERKKITLWIVSARGKMDVTYNTKSEALDYLEYALMCERKYGDDDDTWTDGETEYSLWCKKSS